MKYREFFSIITVKTSILLNKCFLVKDLEIFKPRSSNITGIESKNVTLHGHFILPKIHKW